MAQARKDDKDTRRQRQRELQREKEIVRLKMQRGDRRKRFALWTGGLIVAVAAIAAAVAYALHGTASVDARAVSADLGKPTADLASPPISGFQKSGLTLTQGGKPELLFIGAQYCPHCAGQRWAIIKALNQFGTLSGLTSSTNDDGSIPTFDVLNATYTSRYVAFDHKDVADRNHTNLQALNPNEQKVFDQLDSGGAIPLVAIGGYDVIGDAYDLSVVQGKKFSAVQQALQRDDKSSSLVPAINGEANAVTGFICHADGMQPASVCGRPAIRTVVSSLH